MPGVRIRPRPDRVVPDNAMIVLSDISRPFPLPKDGQRLEDVQPVCSTCGVQHFVKTYHLQLLAGSVIVSETIWAKFETMPENGGFEFMNVVDNPPAQHIAPGEETKLIERYALNDVSPVAKRGRLATLLRPRPPSARAGEEL